MPDSDGRCHHGVRLGDGYNLGTMFATSCESINYLKNSKKGEEDISVKLIRYFP